MLPPCTGSQHCSGVRVVSKTFSHHFPCGTILRGRASQAVGRQRLDQVDKGAYTSLYRPLELAKVAELKYP
jgi:hypothetical protein